MIFRSDIASAAFNSSCVCKVAERSIFDDTSEGSKTLTASYTLSVNGWGYYFLLTALAL